MAKKRAHKPAGVPEWIITYGDMMSLLLCFFILLAAFSELKHEREYREVIQSIQEAFGFVGGSGMTVSEVDPQNASQAKNEELALAGRRRQVVDENSVKNVVGRFTKVATVREGLQFTLGGPVAFEPGSSELKEAAKEELKPLAEVFRGRNNRILIRGHAYGFDATPDKPMDYRDLSYQRAKAVFEYLTEECEIPRRVLSLEAVGDTEPADVRVYTPSEQADNRRVQIILTEIMVDEVHPDPNYTGVKQ